MSVVYDGIFADMVGQRQEVVACPGPTLAHLVEALSQRHGPRFHQAVLDPGSGDIMVSTSVLVNGRRGELADILREGDEVAFLMPFPGG